MRTCRGRNYSTISLLPNENYICHFRIELIGLDLMRFYSVPKMYWRLSILKLLTQSREREREIDFDEMMKPGVSRIGRSEYNAF